MFDSNSFMRTKFTAREQDVQVPALAAFFGDADPVWRVRGLTGSELARVNEAAEAAKNLLAIAEGLVSEDRKEKTRALRELLGLDGEVPQDTVKRIEMLTIASVKPEIDRDVAVRLFEVYPIEMQIVTGVIMRLTGQGKQPGKLPGSGATPGSEPLSTTVTSGDGSSSKSDPISSPKDS